MFQVTSLGSTTVKQCDKEMILSGSIASIASSLRRISTSAADILAIKPPGSPGKDFFNAETLIEFRLKTLLLVSSRLTLDAVRELITGLYETIYWLAIMSLLLPEALITQSCSSRGSLPVDSLFFLQDTMKKTETKRIIFFCMCVTFSC